MIEHDLDPAARDDGETDAERRTLNDALHSWRHWCDDPTGVAPAALPAHARSCVSTASRLFEEMCAAADDVVAEAVEAAVDSLPPRLRQALHHHALGVKWTGAPMEYWPTLCVARRALLNSLQRRGVVVLNED